MKSLFLMFASFVMVMAMPAFFSSVDGARTDSVTENFSAISSSNYTANVTLGQALSHNAVTEITEITSNESSDTPSASTYTSASRVLLVSGLLSSNTRTLSVDYRIASASNPAGLNNFFTMFYWAYVMAIIAFIGGAGYNFFQT